jgi:hypothetical protein
MEGAHGYVNIPLWINDETGNTMFTTSGYILADYKTPNNKFGAELGLRIDHYYLSGSAVSIQSKPVMNPRLNLDFNVFKDRLIFKSFDLSAGTGLFSSLNDFGTLSQEEYGINEIKPDRSWTTVLGAKTELPRGITLNIEGYYKYIFNRLYAPVNYVPGEKAEIGFQFNGEGRVWGIDLVLQKKQSRFWDGWISYSWNWAKYRDPDNGNPVYSLTNGEGNDWYFPYYHRFHNLNLVLNIKPAPRINIYTRFGLASGIPLEKLKGGKPLSYPVWMYDPVNGSKLVEQYYWPTERDENNRTTPALPLDVKLSIFGNNRNGKINYEVYAAVENILVLLYSARGNSSFDPYTGEVIEGSNSASFEMPIPIPSFGVKIRY